MIARLLRLAADVTAELGDSAFTAAVHISEIFRAHADRFDHAQRANDQEES